MSWHHGWTLHAAGGCKGPGAEPRMALAVSFMGGGARLRRRGGRGLRAGMAHDEDAESYEGWVRQLGHGARAAHPCVPEVWPAPRPWEEAARAAGEALRRGEATGGPRAEGREGGRAVAGGEQVGRALQGAGRVARAAAAAQARPRSRRSAGEG